MNDEPKSKTNLATHAAVFVANGEIRRLWFQAASEEEARAFCLQFNAGYEGLSRTPETEVKPAPEAYNATTARELLGGISESTLYRELSEGKLERVPDTRRLLITRASLERRAKSRQAR